VCDKLPSPLELTETKVERLMFTHSRNFSLLPKESQDLKQAFLNCSNSEDSPVIVLVSKMFAVERKALPENRPKVLTSEDIAARREEARQRLADRQAKKNDEENTELPGNGEVNTIAKDDNDNNICTPEAEDEHAFVAFARVYSGTLKKGCNLYVLGPRYDPVIGLQKVRLAMRHYVMSCLIYAFSHSHHRFVWISKKNDNFLLCSMLVGNALIRPSL
jgi:ribosome assembly protein 1